MDYIIYGLIDPNTRKIRYIGQTQQTAEQRLLGHFNDAERRATKPLHFWIRSLRPLCPELVILERVEKRMVSAWPNGKGLNESTIMAAEVKWMKRFEQSQLFNIVDRTGRVYRRLVNPEIGGS